MQAPVWVRPRRARWNACEWALARPGRLSPGSRMPVGGAPGVTAVKTPSVISMNTSRAGASPPSQAYSAW